MNVFLSLLDSYVHCAKINTVTYKKDFIDKVKEVYSMDNPRNKAFIESAENYHFCSIVNHNGKYYLST